ncbi:MAG TPA: phytanoyl-CoA dioxygenase family protein [Chitinophagaceae bacterium]
METFQKLAAAERQLYERDGYVVIKSMYSKKEVDILLDTARNDNYIKQSTYGRKDKEGNTTKLALWYALNKDVYSLFARSERMVEGVELLLGGTPAHFHTKLMQKEPLVGGAWEWHQDYGYWYHDGFLFPDMISVMIALTPANKENGCLQVLKGSHRMGRIEHGMTGDQKGADLEKVNEAVDRLELVYVELEPGDTLFFHCNLLHRSDKNNSTVARWSMISTFNLASNKPYKEQNPSCYTPLSSLPDTAILEESADKV